MHIVTKILVVLAAMLSVLLAALTMAFSFNADRITTSYRDMVTQKNATESASRAAVAEAGAQLQALRDQIASRDQQINELQRQLGEQRQANTLLETRARAAEVARDSMQQQMGQFRETISSMTNLVAVLREEVSGLRTEGLALRRRSIELEDRNSELVGQNEVLSQDLRAVRETLAQMQLDRESTAAGVAATEVVTGPLIQGRVLEVTRDPATGHLLARVSVGANDRIRDNMTLHVVRDGQQFIGKITIMTTDLQYAIGRFDSIGQATQVSVNDMVLSRLR